METDGAAREARKTFDLLVEHFPDMIHSVDADGNLVYVNRAVTGLLGYTADELRGLDIRRLYPPEILEAVEQGFRDVKQDGEKRVESLLMARDGTRIPVELRTLALEEAQKLGLSAKQGVYCWMNGPSYETPAEIRMVRNLGADAVGMSTVPETIVARHSGMRVLGISTITNMAAGVLDQPINHEEVLASGEAVKEPFRNLVDAVIDRLPPEEGMEL